MSVFRRTGRWPNSRVPYVIVGGGPDPETWFGQVNACVGFGLLVPRQATDISYLQLTIGAHSKSEAIGYLGNGMQTIGGTTKHTVIHELLHALGFKHEQLHRRFPWDDTDPPRNRVDRMFSYEGKCQTRNNQNLYKAIQSIQGGLGGKFFADNNLTSRVDALLDPDAEHWGDCDLDSVMLYGDFRKALTSIGMQNANGLVQTGQSAVCDVLSAQDIAALRYMYPPPPPSPPRDFVVRFTGMRNDSLALGFTVRSTAQPSRTSRFTADANGHAVVRGFNPAQAEIKVEPWPFWSAVRLDPRTANALPGGRYTYSVQLA
jgi:hypothetical protein